MGGQQNSRQQQAERERHMVSSETHFQTILQDTWLRERLGLFMSGLEMDGWHQMAQVYITIFVRDR